MTTSLPETLLSQVSEFVSENMGLFFPKKHWGDLETGIRAAAREFNFKDVALCVEWLMSSRLTKNQIEVLAGYMTIGESYFFRDSKVFEVLEYSIFPELIEARRSTGKRLRIWSAGCCSGEEPYSLAILLSRILPDPGDWNITILATDINPRFIKKASNGIYGEWSFRGVPSWVRRKYFSKAGENCYEILPEIKKMVNFSYLNLAEDAYPLLANNTNAMDIILCRNVLMYFGPEPARRVVDNLYRSLVDKGWLLVSQCELSYSLFKQFETIDYSGVVFYGKGGERLQITDKAPEEEFPFSRSMTESTIISQEEVEVPDAVEVCEDPYDEAAELYNHGRYAQAAKTLLAVLNGHKDDAKAMVLLARSYANTGRLEEAVMWCQKAIAVEKLNPSYHYLLATILQEMNAVEEAVLSLKRVLYIDHDFILAYIALGNLALRQGNFGETEKNHQIALSLLGTCGEEDIVPDSENMTAGRLTEIIRLTKISWDRRSADRSRQASRSYSQNQRDDK